MAGSTQQFVTARPTSPAWSRISSTWTLLCVSLLALGLFAIVVVYVQGTYTAVKLSADKHALSNFLKLDVSTTLGIVRACQGLLFALMSGLLNSTFVLVQWNLMSSPDGLSYHNLLSLSPTTDSLGSLAILRSSGSLIDFKSKVWVVVRGFLVVVLWLSGLVLFINTSIITVYDTAHTYKATAGVGPFNASLVEPFTRLLQSTAPAYPYQVMPFNYLASVYILVVNPLISTVAAPVRCIVGNRCLSYLLSGGLEMVAPWVPLGHDRHTMVRIDNAPSVQLDFSSPASDSFLDTDCDDFGKTGFNIGIRLCVVGQPDDTGLRVGLFVCPKGTTDSACSFERFPSKPNITTNVSFYTRATTLVAARSNYSITSIEGSTPPVLFPASSIDVPSYRQSLRWLLNFTAADIPPPTSIAQSFWSSQRQLSGPAPPFGVLEQNFHSIVAFPFWLFNSNNWANPELRSDEIIDTLPPQFYTTASIVEPVVKIRFDRTMFLLFVAFQGVAMVFVWAVLVWVWVGGGGGGGREDSTHAVVEDDGQGWEERKNQGKQHYLHVPKRSSFPLWDIVFRAKTVGGNFDEIREEEMMNADNKAILHLVKNTRVYYGHGPVQTRTVISDRLLHTMESGETSVFIEETGTYSALLYGK